MSQYASTPDDPTLALDLVAVRDALASGRVTASAVCQACLTRIEATEPHLHALTQLNDKALDQAKALDEQGADPAKPLWGVPIAIKDSIATKGLSTTACSAVLKNFLPFYDATVVERLQNAGAIILAKTNMDEFAMGSSTESSIYGPTHNPHDLSRTPGGSSGGSAAAVTAFQAYAALGSDTGGSIRQPAALCGCVGLKPTYGAVSRYGLIAYGSSLDQIGPLTRSVRDAALIFDIIAGHDPRDSTSSQIQQKNTSAQCINSEPPSLKGVRLGIAQDLNKGLESGVQTVYQETLERAKNLGATLVPITLPNASTHAIASYYIIAMAEASSNLARFDGVRYGHRAEHNNKLEELYVRSRTEGFGQEVQRRILLGTYVLSSGYYDAYYKKAAQVRRLIKQDFTTALADCDAILSPVSPVTAWPLGTGLEDPLQMYLMDIFTVSINLAGLPSLAFPAGFADKLPVGLQLIGQAFDEASLVRIANQFYPSA